jgi:hypothetical protein
MIRWKAPFRGALAACGLLTMAACGSPTFDVDGLRIYGLDASNNLVEFGTRSADEVKRREIRGLQEDEVLVGIDFRPAEGSDTDFVYGVGSTGRVYKVETGSGQATPLGGGAVLEGEAFGVDFNPAADRIRVHGSGGLNLRLDPNTGGVAAVDARLAFAPGDPGAVTTPRVVGTAYTNSTSGATGATPTTLYGIDSNRDALVVLPSPNNGQVITVGPLGVNSSDDVGFEIATISPSDEQVAFATLSEGRVTRLYRIDLATGAARLIGRIASRTPIRSITIRQGQSAKP